MVTGTIRVRVRMRVRLGPENDTEQRDERERERGREDKEFGGRHNVITHDHTNYPRARALRSATWHHFGNVLGKTFYG